MPKLDEDYTL